MEIKYQGKEIKVFLDNKDLIDLTNKVDIPIEFVNGITIVLVKK